MQHTTGPSPVGRQIIQETRIPLSKSDRNSVLEEAAPAFVCVPKAIRKVNTYNLQFSYN